MGEVAEKLSIFKETPLSVKSSLKCLQRGQVWCGSYKTWGSRGVLRTTNYTLVTDGPAPGKTGGTTPLPRDTTAAVNAAQHAGPVAVGCCSPPAL